MTLKRYRCPECGYVYDEAVGDRHEGFAPGTTWDRLPGDFCCPDCAVRYKDDFTLLPSSGDRNPPGADT